MAPIGSTNLNEGACRIRQEYPPILRRSQRIASSSQTPLRQEIKLRAGSGSNNSTSPSPTRTRQAKPIQPQVTYHPQQLQTQPNFDNPYTNTNNTSRNNQTLMRGDTPLIRQQAMFSEDEDNIFESTRITQPANENMGDFSTRQTATAHNLMLLETPGRIRTLIDRLTPSALSKRILSNGLPPEPSSPLLSIPTVRANKVRFENDMDSETLESGSDENLLLTVLTNLVLFLPRFFWNNIQTILTLAYYLFVYPFQKTAKILFTKENVSKTPRGKNTTKVTTVNWAVLGVSIFIFILGTTGLSLTLGFLLNVNYVHNTTFKEKEESVSSSSATNLPQPSVPVKPLDKSKETNEELERLLAGMNEKIGSLEARLLKQSSQVKESIQLESHIKEMASLKDQVQWLKKEHSSIQSLIEKTAIGMPVSDQSSNAANFEVLTSMVSNMVQEGNRELREMHEHLLQKISEIEKQKEEEKRKEVVVEKQRVNWAIRSLGTRIYRLGTSPTYKKSKGWRGYLQAAGRPTIIQDSNPVTEPGDAWCFPGFKGHVTLAFSVPLQIEALRIQNPYEHQPSKVKVYGRTSAFSQQEHHLGSFPFKNNQVLELKSQADGIKYLRIVFESEGEFAVKTCIYRVAVYGKEM